MKNLRKMSFTSLLALGLALTLTPASAFADDPGEVPWLDIAFQDNADGTLTGSVTGATDEENRDYYQVFGSEAEAEAMNVKEPVLIGESQFDGGAGWTAITGNSFTLPAADSQIGKFVDVVEVRTSDTVAAHGYKVIAPSDFNQTKLQDSTLETEPGNGGEPTPSENKRAKKRRDNRPENPVVRDNAGADASATSDESHWVQGSDVTAVSRGSVSGGQGYARSQSTGLAGMRSGGLRSYAGYRFQHDTMANGVVEVRLYLNPDVVQSDLLLSGRLSNEAANSAREVFSRYFSNRIQAVAMDQPGEWGQRARVAARLGLSGWDTQSLCFYSYNSSLNTYRQIKEPNYRIDANGYLHFETKYAGTIIISEGALNSLSKSVR